MTETIAKYKTRNPLKGLSPVLHRWIENVEKFSSVNKGDACYWYNERANLSVLAAAGWQTAGWTGIEEFSTEKRAKERDLRTGRLLRFSGRCDLYLTSLSVQACAEYAFEAKQAWQPIGSRVSNPYANLETTRKRSWSDAGKLHIDEAAHRLALTFCAPWHRPHEHRREDQHRIAAGPASASR